MTNTEEKAVAAESLLWRRGMFIWTYPGGKERRGEKLMKGRKKRSESRGLNNANRASGWRGKERAKKTMSWKEKRRECEVGSDTSGKKREKNV